MPLEIPISADADDGVETDNLHWDPLASPLLLGRTADGSVLDLGLRFGATELVGVDSVLFARLRFDARGCAFTEGLTYSITGAREIYSPPFSPIRRPSRLPRTSNRLVGTVTEPWLDGLGNPLFYYSEDISPVLNEILALPGWPAGPAAVVLCLDDSSAVGSPPDLISCSAFNCLRCPVTLQVCRTLEEAFLCHEALSRPTAAAVTISFTTMVPMQVYVEYGPGEISEFTESVTSASDRPCLIMLSDLQASSAYRYRLRYRLADSEEPFACGPERTFHTQRPPGEPFTFTAQADSHIWDYWGRPHTGPEHLALYEQTLQNIWADEPDFHFSLGDFSMTEYSRTWINALDRYVVQRRFLDRVLHSIPFFLVMGNHEGELGWRLGTEDSLVVWAERARRMQIPNPFPDGFYDGCTEPPLSGSGFRESYYSWEWGDALFVVLDPYWYTLEKPYHSGVPGTGAGWKWSLGQSQYDWLHRVLHDSDRRWKIVMLHHLVGGVESVDGSYGRGGTEVVKWAVAQRPSFEWGGEDEVGGDVFALRRPGWSHGPVHDLLRDAGVSLVLHGHDHFCAVQAWDGVTYALCPRPMDPTYDDGARSAGGYVHGLLQPNSGHLRLRVTPDDLVVEYVRSYLEGDGPNGEVSLSWSVSAAAGTPEPVPAVISRLRITPNPAVPGAAILIRPSPARFDGPGGDLRIYDPAGRLQVRLLPGEDGTFRWDQRSADGRLVPAGIFYGRVDSGESRSSGTLVLVR